MVTLKQQNLQVGLCKFIISNLYNDYSIDKKHLEQIRNLSRYRAFLDSNVCI